MTRNQLLALMLSLSLIAGLGMQCTKEQKKAVVDTTITGLIQLLERAKNPLVGDIVAGVKAFRDDPSDSNYKRGLSAFDAVLARHDLSATMSILAVMARGIFVSLIPSKIAAPMSDAEGEAAKKELRRKFDELERAVEKLEKETK